MFTTLISAVLAFPHFPAAASFEANTVGATRNLGIGVGVMRLFSDDATTPDLIGTLWLEGAWLADDWLQVFLSVPVGIGQVKFGAPTVSGAGLVLLTGGQLGVRYVLLSDARIRPVVGAHLTGLYVLTSSSSVLLGAGAHAGVELEVASSISVRFHGSFDWFITLNAPQRLSAGTGLTVSTSF